VCGPAGAWSTNIQHNVLCRRSVAIDVVISGDRQPTMAAVDADICDEGGAAGNVYYDS
jgi:hypothetical protein